MTTLFSDIALDPVTGDLDFSSGTLELITSNQVSLRQRLYLRFFVWMGDWFFDETFGFPYRIYLSKKVLKTVLDARIKSTIRLEPDVIRIDNFRSFMDKSSRTYEAYMDVITAEGESVALAFSGSQGFDYPTPPDNPVGLCEDSAGWVKWQNKLYYLVNFRMPPSGDATWNNTWA